MNLWKWKILKKGEVLPAGYQLKRKCDSKWDDERTDWHGRSISRWMSITFDFRAKVYTTSGEYYP